METEAASRVEERWPVIAEFAEELHRPRVTDTVYARAFITSRLSR